MRPRHLYIHVPFCGRRCSYCDFSIAVRRPTPVDEYIAALGAELDLRFPRTEPWTLDTVYLGGGTPSRLGGPGIARVLDLLRGHATIAKDAEITIEANPDDVDPASAAAWRDAGVNRISVGAQSFEPRVLEWMHRTHDVGSISRAVAATHEAGITDISLDLIFALPESLHRDWSRDLEMALALEPTHLSLYGLTIEAQTPLGRRGHRGEVVEAPEERYEAEFLEADQRLTAAGFEHYEVSNFGRPGYRARHNSSYWSGVPYAGIGPAAHAFDGQRRRWNVAAYAEWVTRIGRGMDPVAGVECLTDTDRIAESVYLGVRTSDGLPLAEPELARVAPWIKAGWAAIRDGRLRLTPAGWLRLDSLAADLTVFRSR